MAQPDIDPDIQKAQTLLRGFGFHARVRGENGEMRRTPLEVTGKNDSLTQRSLQRFKADNQLPPDADLKTTIARMEQEGVGRKYQESLARQGFQYPYTGQPLTAAAPAPAASTAPAAPTPAATVSPAATTLAQKTETASYLMMMGYDVTDDVNRNAINDTKFAQAMNNYRQANQVPIVLNQEETMKRMRESVAANPMSVELMMGVSNTETPTQLETTALQYGLKAHGFDVPVTGQAGDPQTKAAMTQLVDRHQAKLDSGELVQTENGYAAGTPKPPAPEATVEQAQAYLRILGYTNVGPVDNIRGPLTNAALTQFARDNQMAEDASLNDLTAAMKAKVISDPNVMVRAEAIIRGDSPSRSEVKSAQFAINARSGGNIATDGIVGGETTTAFYNTQSLDNIRAQAAAPAGATPAATAPVAAAPATATPAPAAGAAAPLTPLETVTLPPATPVATVDLTATQQPAAAPVSSARGAAQNSPDVQQRQDPVNAPDGYRIGHRGTLSPYQRDVAGMRGGPDFDPARPQSLQEMRMQQQQQRMQEMQERREAMQRERDANTLGRGIGDLLDGNNRNDGRAFGQLAGVIARIGL